MFYKVTLNTEPLLLGEIQGQGVLPATRHNILSTHQCITLFCVYICSKTPDVTYVVASLILFSQPTAHAQNLLNADIFSVRHSLPVRVGTLQHLSLTYGDHLTVKSPILKAPKTKIQKLGTK